MPEEVIAKHVVGVVPRRVPQHRAAPKGGQSTRHPGAVGAIHDRALDPRDPRRGQADAAGRGRRGQGGRDERE